ncbi:hypothetical protein ACFXAE_05660 [Streptomyces sp. NPDC059454]|uniref:hypothetical protein n=1 Tax=Streptomyces sp. NPDC059454 TaxID=3346836 RepID=UPI003686EFA3
MPRLFGTGDLLLRWPEDLVVVELTRLIEGTAHGTAPSRTPDPWVQEVTLFLQEVFGSEAVRREWTAVCAGGTWGDEAVSPDAQVEWLRDLREAVVAVPQRPSRPAYWTRRSADAQVRPLGLRETAAAVADVVAELQRLGYLVWAFGQDCVDLFMEGELGADPAGRVHQVLGRSGLWPITACHVSYSLNDLADVVEFLADHVRRPTSSYLHDYADCGTHFNGFDAERGLQVYRVRINAVLGRSDMGLELAENGRLQPVVPPGLRELVDGTLTGPSVNVADARELSHAVERFRARGATDLDRRHAVIALAGILERRRGLVSEKLLTKDAGMLFHIANNFGIRHQKADQRTAYDPGLYLEWVFYLFLSVINLTDRIVGEQERAARDTGAAADRSE